jgi:hypothetical protein
MVSKLTPSRRNFLAASWGDVGSHPDGVQGTVHLIHAGRSAGPSRDPDQGEDYNIGEAG